ncbi:MAG: aldehyde dehydrogenase family protein [Terrimicrobiaceae bacterium]
MNPKPLYINGRHVPSGESHPVHNPWDGVHLGDVCLADALQVESAVASAHAAFQVTRKMTADARAAVLENMCTLIAARRSDFVSTIVAEAGKPVAFAEAETERTRLTFRFAAALALSDEGHGITMDASAPGAGHFGMVKRFPMGVILGITPFNFPLNLVAHKVAPCLATGNTMVLKPALKTPLSSLLLAEVLDAAGVPPGQINVVPFRHDCIAPLLEDPRIKMVSFTGSAAVGWHLKAKAARKKVALELGGNAAIVVEPDCDWRAAIPKIAAAAYGYAGQSCISVQRILVHTDIHDAFREELAAYITAKVVAGDPSEKSTIVGPMINAAEREKILGWIDDAQTRGARLLTPLRIESHSLLGPILLENVPPDCSALCEEAFAPLAVLQRYESFPEALAMVNDSAFGLQAGVFTTDIRKGLLAFEELEVGGVMIGQVPTFRVENMPYGGVKESGFGREGVRYSMEEMTEPRSLVINRN